MTDRPGRARDEHEASRAVLDRVARDAQGVGDSALARMGAHFAARDAEGAAEGGGTDPAELWGRRIGRVLSVGLAATLLWWLGAQLRWW